MESKRNIQHTLSFVNMMTMRHADNEPNEIKVGTTYLQLRAR
jgi:hypothetical protein